MTAERAHIPPDYSYIGTLDLLLRPVNVGKALQSKMLYEAFQIINPIGTHLAKVELGLFLVQNTLNLDERGVGVSVAFAALVAKNAALCVESARW